MYGFDQAPYRLPKLLTPRLFVLEYVRQLTAIDMKHFRKSKKRGRITNPIAMGGYAFSNNNEASEAIKLLEELKFH
uniref:Uncharacterized protein n=1 Tax=Picea glauca TaxID=3330 RepID=A0A101M038_PICGL|nr:hypothetical protein ABT39_MTgene4522 [Picea glauca]QHR86703.1 hypothetical protein Q903MT_gene707 [Picea sitchensis]